jgi:threonine-phosphate decarboxylase
MAVHGGDLRAAREKYGDLDFIDFSANINPLGPPRGVFEAIDKNIAKIIHYPDPNGWGVKTLLGDKLGVATEQLILGNGAVELVYLLAHALKPRTAFVLEPTFSEYSRALKAVGCQIRHTYLNPLRGFELDINDLELADCDILFLCNPNNPTGSFMSEEDFVRILDLVKKHGTFLVLDESFMDFVALNKQWRSFRYLREYDKLFVLYSLTKFYAIPGLRLGCGIGSPEFIRTLGGMKDPWNVNNLALAAGEAALGDAAYSEMTRQCIETEREFLINDLKKIAQLKVFPGFANFLLIENLGEPNGERLVDALANKGILIRNCGNFPGLGENYFRIAVKDHLSNIKLVSGLKEILTNT